MNTNYFYDNRRNGLINDGVDSIHFRASAYNIWHMMDNAAGLDVQ